MSSLYEKIQVIHFPSTDEPFVVLYKPKNLPSAPLIDGEPSALTFAAEKFPQIKNVAGKKTIEYGLVHRIDTETDGLLLVACTQDFYDSMIVEQSEGRFVKAYSAICDFSKPLTEEGFPMLDCEISSSIDKFVSDINQNSIEISLCSKFRPYGVKNRMVRPVSSSSGKAALKKCSPKEYETAIVLRRKEGNIFEAQCSIKEGYRHQVRCHLKWLGFPVCGDKLYGIHSEKYHEMKFSAVGLDFLGFSFTCNTI